MAATPAFRLRRNSVHGFLRLRSGQAGSPRTDGHTPKFNDLAVRPDALEGRTANCDTVSFGQWLDCFQALGINRNSLGGMTEDVRAKRKYGSSKGPAAG